LKSSAEDLKLPARAERFRDFGAFPPTLLNFRLTIRISSERPELPLATPQKLRESAIFRKTLERRPAAEKIRPRFDMSSDSFVLAADKRRVSLTTF